VLTLVCNRLNMHRTLFMGKDTFLVVFGLLSLNAAFSVLSLQASMANYPGGEALSFFNAHYANVSYGRCSFSTKISMKQPQGADPFIQCFVVHVHISNLAAQTGASLFMQENSPPYIASFTLSQPDLEARGRNWTYDKTEGLTPFDLTNGPYTHLIVETPMDASLSSAQGSTGWKEVATIDGFAGWLVDRSWIRMVERIDVVGLVEGIKNGGPITMKREEKLKILERT
jgi:alpha-1,6-mannosyltransferase